jgi:hypothetical protein
MHMPAFQFFLIIASFLMTCGVMTLMVNRSLRTTYPLLFSYLAVNALTVPILLAIFRYAPNQYFFAYWMTSTMSMLVGFAVQYEVFVAVFKPFSAVIDLGKMLFFWAAAFLLFAGFLTALATSGTHSSKIVVAVDLCDRCVHMMQCGLMLLMVVFQKRLNLSWRSSGMAIALGLGIIAAMDLIVSYAQTRFPGWENGLAILNSTAFSGALILWAVRFSSREIEPAKAAAAPSRLIIQRWNDALISYRQGDMALSSLGMNSFLPGVEQTVERILASKMVQ